MDPKMQSDLDRQTIKVRLIENAVLVSAGEGWVACPDDNAALDHIKHRLAALRQARTAKVGRGR